MDLIITVTVQFITIRIVGNLAEGPMQAQVPTSKAMTDILLQNP